MPDEKDEKPTAEELASVAPDKPNANDEAKLTVERLIADGQAALGFSSADVAGAFHGVSPNREVSIKSAKERVRKWLRAPDSTSVQDDEE